MTEDEIAGESGGTVILAHGARRAGAVWHGGDLGRHAIRAGCWRRAGSVSSFCGESERRQYGEHGTG